MTRAMVIPYSVDFYSAGRETSQRSAREIVPLILDLVPVRSVADVGCGIGNWLRVFEEHGVSDVYGVDGSWVDRDMLQIAPEAFHPWDLSVGLRVDRRFDLAMSIEVAEHLPPASAASFVASLTGLAPLVLFSAAIPYQGGTNHVNEQWPDYWAQKFADHGFTAIDCLRPKLWNNPRVDVWHAQNVILYADGTALERYPQLKDSVAADDGHPRALVHPWKYLHLARLVLAAQDLAVIAPDQLCIVVDDDQCPELRSGRRTLPFLEREGRYWGPPADDATALRELERLRHRDAKYIAFAWPALWWLTHYTAFHETLRARYRCVVDNERIVAFALA